jgi:hypothetical protein
MTLDQLLSSLITLLTRSGSNRVSGADVLTAMQQVVNFFATQIASIIPDWTDSATFNADGSGAGKYAKYADTTGKKRIFESKTAGNINHLPPSDPGITENTYWKEVSASAVAAIPEYAPGIFPGGIVIVYHNHSVDGRGLYFLVNAVRPYSSTNIETEITAGDWELLGGASSGGGTWGSITGTVTDQTDLVTYITTRINAVIDSAPGALDTLNELAAALGDDSNFAATVTAALAAKEASSNKDTANGYVGLSSWSIKFRNLANTFTSLLQNAATAIRTYTFPDRDITVAGVDDVVGVQDLFIPASAMWPRQTAGCGVLTQTEIATSLINIQTLDFDQTTQEYAQYHLKFPRKYNLGTITFRTEWTSTTGTGSVVRSLAAVALADGDALSTAFGTPVNVTDAAGAANTLRTSPESAVVTIGNTPASADGIFLEVSRVSGNGSDDMPADAKLKGIWVHITTNAAKDA